MRHSLIAAALWLSLSAAGFAQAQEIERTTPESAAAALSGHTSVKVDPRLKAAALQQEIVLTLLKRGDYDAILPEFQEILDLRLGNQYEGLLTDGTWSVANALREREQFELAHQIVDATLPQISQDGNIASLLLLKGKIFKDQGRTREALQAYRQAQKLQPLANPQRDN